MSDTQKETGLFLIHLSEFLKKENPNPFVAIAGLSIAKHQFEDELANTLY
ncbi:MAG: hypothetical protein PHW62_00770 [Candidatus Ratteibacteria bacterium]|nr:hypothetical protein [Candidatus Ratteibacteria bacterium]